MNEDNETEQQIGDSGPEENSELNPAIFHPRCRLTTWGGNEGPRLHGDEILIWLFDILLKEGQRIICGTRMLVIEKDKLIVDPYFDEDIDRELRELVDIVTSDKDFFRKYNMTNYGPDFTIVPESRFVEGETVIFTDFTEDFMKEYLENRLGVKKGTKSKILMPRSRKLKSLKTKPNQKQ